MAALMGTYVRDQAGRANRVASREHHGIIRGKNAGRRLTRRRLRPRAAAADILLSKSSPAPSRRDVAVARPLGARSDNFPCRLLSAKCFAHQTSALIMARLHRRPP